MNTTTDYTHQEARTDFICPLCGYNDCRNVFTCTDYFVSDKKFNIVSCNNCGLRITQNNLNESELDTYYHSVNYISHSNTRKGATNRIYHIARKWMLKKKRKWIEKHISGSEKNLLDVGCGTGYFAAYMQKHGWSVLGVEKNDATRAFISKKFEFKVESSVRDIDKNSQFNVITLWHVLEHLSDLNNAMQPFSRLLTRQGTLFIAVPNYTSVDAAKYRNHWVAYDVPRHLWHFAPAQMQRLAEKHGFQVTAIKPLHLDGFYISILSEKYKGSSIYFIKGFLSGLNTWLKALANIEKSSSLLYVLEKLPE